MPTAHLVSRFSTPGAGPVLRRRPTQVFAFGKGEPYSQTRFTSPAVVGGVAPPQGSEGA